MFSPSNSLKRPSPLDVSRCPSRPGILTGKGGAMKGEIAERPSKGECQRESSILGDRLIK